jgi:hypothetical protein
VSPTPRQWTLELVVRTSTSVSVWGHLNGAARTDGPLVCSSFSDALRAARTWLDEFDPDGGERITTLLRAPSVPVSAWSTSSPSAALYWFAVQLSHSWVHLPELTRWSRRRRDAGRTLDEGARVPLLRRRLNLVD